MNPADALRPLPWQQTLWQLLQSARRAGRLGHAWILQGQEGVGRSRYARALAASLLCRQADAHGLACGSCQDCRLILAAAHPGLSWVAPEEDRQRISIDQVRDAAERIGYTSHDGRAKILVFRPAESLTPAAGNALLKTLEEPPADTLLLLLSEQPGLLLATIRSRCRNLRFAAPDPALAESWLGQNVPDAAPQAIQTALQRHPGAPLLARSDLLADNRASDKEYSAWFKTASAGNTDPISLAGEIPRERLGDFLRWAQRQLADAGIQAATDGASRTPLRALLARYAGLIESRRRLEGNVNPLLTTEQLLIRWRQLARHHSEASRPGGS